MTIWSIGMGSSSEFVRWLSGRVPWGLEDHLVPEALKGMRQRVIWVIGKVKEDAAVWGFALLLFELLSVFNNVGEVAGGIVNGPFKYRLDTCVLVASVKDCIEEGAEFFCSILRLGTEAKTPKDIPHD